MHQCIARFYYFNRLRNNIGRSGQTLPQINTFHRVFRFLLFHFLLEDEDVRNSNNTDINCKKKLSV